MYFQLQFSNHLRTQGWIWMHRDCYLLPLIWVVWLWACGRWLITPLINTILWFGIYWQYFSYNVDNIQFSRNWRWFECDLHVICIENKNVWDVMYASSFVMATLLYYVFNSIWWIIKQYSTCIYLKRELSIFPIKVFSFSIYLAWLKKESDPTFFLFFLFMNV